MIAEGLDKRELQLNNRTYSILMPTPTKGMPLVTQASVTLAPIITGLEATKSGSTEVLMMLIGRLDPTALNDLMMRTVEVSKLTVDGIPICTEVTFNKHFQGCRSDIYPVCFWALLEVCGDFFPVLAAFSQGVRQQMTTG